MAVGSVLGGLLPGLWPALTEAASFRGTFWAQAAVSLLAAAIALLATRRRPVAR